MAGEASLGCSEDKECGKCNKPPHAPTCQCKLKPYKNGCDGGLTPHHCVPDHCFRAPGQPRKYYGDPPPVPYHEGLCVCVDGPNKSTAKQHGKIHQTFDAAEAELGKADNSASLGELEKAAADAISTETGCDKEDLEGQLRSHHNSKGLGPGTRLRADPWGRKQPPPFAEMGVSNISQTSTNGFMS